MLRVSQSYFLQFEVVGTGTAKILTAAGIRPSFEAVDMSAKGLARELPKVRFGCMTNIITR